MDKYEITSESVQPSSTSEAMKSLVFIILASDSGSNSTQLKISGAAVLRLTQIGHSLLWRDGAVLHHHLHKVNQCLHDGDQCLSLLDILF